jgi:hypothetical protein
VQADPGKVPTAALDRLAEDALPFGGTRDLVPTPHLVGRAAAVGSQDPDGWTVRVTMTTPAGPAAALSLLYRPEPVAGLGEVAVPDLPPAGPPRAQPGRFCWPQLAVGPIRWQGGPAAGRAALLPAVTGADLWTTLFPPSHGIAPAAIEAAVIAAADDGDLAGLRWSRVQVCPGAQRVTTLYRAGPGGPWSGLLDGRAVLRFVPPGQPHPLRSSRLLGTCAQDVPLPPRGQRRGSGSLGDHPRVGVAAGRHRRPGRAGRRRRLDHGPGSRGHGRFRREHGRAHRGSRQAHYYSVIAHFRRSLMIRSPYAFITSGIARTVQLPEGNCGRQFLLLAPAPAAPGGRRRAGAATHRAGPRRIIPNGRWCSLPDEIRPTWPPAHHLTPAASHSPGSRRLPGVTQLVDPLPGDAEHRRADAQGRPTADR